MAGPIIQREQGGSVFTVKSTGKIEISDGASLNVKSGATTNNEMYAVMKMGNNTLWYAPGSAGSPITSGSPGDLLWIANSGMWLNVSDGTTGSKWDFIKMGSTGSQIVSGP